MAVKYASLPIGQLTKAALRLHVQTTLFRINAITGWKIDTNPTYQNILEEEFEKYLIENHSDLNFQEIPYAVRNYGLEIKDWGKSMNVSLLNQPIALYRGRRIELSDLESRLKDQVKENNKPAELPMEADWSMVWSDILISAQENRVAKKIIPVPVYDWLVRKAKLKLTAAERTEYYERARELYKADLLTRYAIDQISLDERTYLDHIKAGADLEHENTKNVIVNRAKVLAVREFAIKEVQQ